MAGYSLYLSTDLRFLYSEFLQPFIPMLLFWDCLKRHSWHVTIHVGICQNKLKRSYCTSNCPRMQRGHIFYLYVTQIYSKSLIIELHGDTKHVWIKLSFNERKPKKNCLVWRMEGLGKISEKGQLYDAKKSAITFCLFSRKVMVISFHSRAWMWQKASSLLSSKLKKWERC